MSTKFETPANDGQSSHSDRDDVVNLMLFSCAFDKPPVSSNNDNSTPTSGTGNLLRMSDWLSSAAPRDTTGSTVNKVMSSLGNILHNPSSAGHMVSGALDSILPKVLIEGNDSHHNSGCATPERPSLQNLLKPHNNGATENVAPTHLPKVNPHGTTDNGSNPSRPPSSKIDNTLPSIINNTVPNESRPPSSKIDNTLPSIINNPIPRPGSGSDNSAPPPHVKTPSESRPSSGSDNSSPPPQVKLPSVPRPGSGSDESAPPPHGRSPIESQPPSSGSDKRNRDDVRSPDDKRTPLDNIHKFPPIDRSSKFKFPEDKPLDAKEADEMAGKVAKWMKESIDKDGNLKLDQNTLDRLKDALNYGVNHGEKGLQEMIAKINKQLEGSGIEIKSDGKAFAHFKTCMPDIERGDHLGDFIGFDVMKGGKKVDSNLVKVGPGIFDR